jgi:hypothetical protein
MPENAIRGFPWFIRPETNRYPFSRPEGPLRAWPIEAGEPGVHNGFGAAAYIVVTDRPEPPQVEAGWKVEPARLDTDFDSQGVRLIRVAATHKSLNGELQEAVFEVAGP